MTAANKTVQIGLLGLGNIGGGVWNLLLDFAELELLAELLDLALLEDSS